MHGQNCRPAGGTLAHHHRHHCNKRLTQGSLLFSLTVTDNPGLKLDTVQVTKCGSCKQNPVAKAGADVTIPLPTRYKFEWKWLHRSRRNHRTIGGLLYYCKSFIRKTVLSNHIQGVYSFQLQVTDNGGAIGLDTILVTECCTSDQSIALASAGADMTITLPANSEF
jgi:hypothetical protein